MYSGDKRDKSHRALRNHDIVLTSYGTLASECELEDRSSKSRSSKKKQKLDKELEGFLIKDKVKQKTTADLNYEEFRASLQKGPLFNVIFQRVILDEAHTIKNHNSRGSIACSQLKSAYRWYVCAFYTFLGA